MLLNYFKSLQDSTAAVCYCSLMTMFSLLAAFTNSLNFWCHLFTTKGLNTLLMRPKGVHYIYRQSQCVFNFLLHFISSLSAGPVLLRLPQCHLTQVIPGHSCGSRLVLKGQYNLSCHTWRLGSAGAVFLICVKPGRATVKPSKLGGEIKKTTMWHIRMNEGSWWAVNKSSIAGLQDEGLLQPAAEMTNCQRRSHQPESFPQPNSEASRVSLPERQRLKYRCLYLLSFQPVCQLVRDMKVIGSPGEKPQEPPGQGPKPESTANQSHSCSLGGKIKCKERRVFGVFSKKKYTVMHQRVS